MPKLYHDEMVLLSAEEVERIYRATDACRLHRDWVVVPLDCAPEGRELVMPDGKILLHAPRGPAFEPWMAALPGRLAELPLSRVPRAHEDDPKRELTGLWGPRPVGTRRYLDPSGAA